MTNPVQAAWTRGCALDDGAGFWLCVRLVNGPVLSGSAYEPKDGMICVDVSVVGEGASSQILNDPITTWIAVEHVVAAWIEE